MNAATYSPEDNKLRLYVGRVPRDEYEALRAEGWTSTPKQSCDFVAVWTPERRDRALSYAEIIEDEDQGPAERAADRAERFAEYRDKRTDEATGHADRYDAGPSAHGFQSQARAERSAARHDRVAGRACDAWSKAEYWQRRTAGVISHALHVSTPSVRMGRIKTLESELRRLLATWKGCEEKMHARAQDWKTHLELRLAYENQMLEAQGGRAGVLEIERGGTFGRRVIAKVNKSAVTGRVVSVAVIGPRFEGWTYRASNEPGTPFALYQIEVERRSTDSYAAPTDESRAALAVFDAARAEATKKHKAANPTPALINPTPAEAEKLQALWNEQAKADHCTRHLNAYGRDYAAEFKGSTVCYITQADYSATSKGAYARTSTREICHEGKRLATHYNAKRPSPTVCKLRTTSGDGSTYGAPRVIVLTDKAQKPFPAELWTPYVPEPAAPAFTLEMSEASTP